MFINEYYLNIVRRARDSLRNQLDSRGRVERLLDDERRAAADNVLGDDPEVVGRVLLEATDLDGGDGARADLLPRLLSDFATLDDVLADGGAAVAFRNVPAEFHRTVARPVDGGRAGRRRWFV